MLGRKNEFASPAGGGTLRGTPRKELAVPTLRGLPAHEQCAFAIQGCLLSAETVQTLLRHARSRLAEVGSQQAGDRLGCAQGGARREKDQMDCFPPSAPKDQVLAEQADQ